jgi:hypothetical protein
MGRSVRLGTTGQATKPTHSECSRWLAGGTTGDGEADQGQCTIQFIGGESPMAFAMRRQKIKKGYGVLADWQQLT